MKAIFFDTNFFYQKSKPMKSFFLDLDANGFTCFVPRMVIDEIKSHNKREIDKEIESIEKISSGHLSVLYFPLDGFLNSLNMKKIYSESDAKVEKYFHEMFEKNIIENVSKEEMMDTILERDSFKKPPFRAEASDKGWKDTIIWTTILRFCKTNKIDEAYFVTKDGFDKQETVMIEEFEREVGKPIQFLKETPDSLFKCLKIEEENDVKLETNDTTGSTKAKESILDNDAIDKIKSTIRRFSTSYIPYNSFGDCSPEPNFVLHEQIDDIKAERFCDEMLKDKKLYVFYDNVDLDKYLELANIKGYCQYSISISEFNDFVDCWDEIKNNYSSYRKQFIAKLTDVLNSQYKEEQNNSDASDDLPF